MLSFYLSLLICVMLLCRNIIRNFRFSLDLNLMKISTASALVTVFRGVGVRSLQLDIFIIIGFVSNMIGHHSRAFGHQHGTDKWYWWHDQHLMASGQINPQIKTEEINQFWVYGNSSYEEHCEYPVAGEKSKWKPWWNSFSGLYIEQDFYILVISI